MNDPTNLLDLIYYTKIVQLQKVCIALMGVFTVKLNTLFGRHCLNPGPVRVNVCSCSIPFSRLLTSSEPGIYQIRIDPDVLRCIFLENMLPTLLTSRLNTDISLLYIINTNHQPQSTTQQNIECIFYRVRVRERGRTE